MPCCCTKASAVGFQRNEQIPISAFEECGINEQLVRPCCSPRDHVAGKQKTCKVASHSLKLVLLSSR